ncbi:MAG TPA: hypothetical protein VMJ74_15370 [Pseudomonadales bacterium]|nr:hypothetical protein [Pseudomonadales bacterium]
MFKLLGVLVAAYAAYGAWSGEVYARSGPGGRKVSRDDSPRYFWTVIAIYAVLAVALLTVF